MDNQFENADDDFKDDAEVERFVGGVSRISVKAREAVRAICGEVAQAIPASEDQRTSYGIAISFALTEMSMGILPLLASLLKKDGTEVLQKLAKEARENGTRPHPGMGMTRDDILFAALFVAGGQCVTSDTDNVEYDGLELSQEWFKKITGKEYDCAMRVRDDDEKGGANVIAK